MMKIFIATILSALVLFANGGVAMAISSEQKKVFDSGVFKFNAFAPNEDSCTETEMITLQGSSNEQRAYNFFIDNGFTPEQSAGIVANLIAESGVMPNRVQGSGMITFRTASEITPNRGYGIAQWTTADRQNNWKRFATEQNKPVTDLGLQLQFLLNELETNSGYGLNHLKEAGDLRQATWIFLSFFERPGTVVDAGKEADPVQPTSGPAKTTLDERVENGNKLTGLSSDDSGGLSGGAGDSCSGNPSFVPGTEEPSFAANLEVKIDDPNHNIPFNASQCTPGQTPGAESLSKFVMAHWSPPVTDVSGYLCRKTTNGISISVHGLGRALDIMVDGTSAQGLKTGDEIRNFMINNAASLGVQRVIWNRHIWDADESGWQPYDGPNPHTDHLHVEINLEASKNANLAN